MTEFQISSGINISTETMFHETHGMRSYFIHIGHLIHLLWSETEFLKKKSVHFPKAVGILTVCVGPWFALLFTKAPIKP